VSKDIVDLKPTTPNLVAEITARLLFRNGFRQQKLLKKNILSCRFIANLGEKFVPVKFVRNKILKK
jgi:hypothetical protein